MQRFFFTTSDFLFNLSSCRPTQPPYTGTLLPAVIHTFDFQVDIEEAETQRLVLLAEALEQELVTMTVCGNTACTSLEPERPELVRRLTSLSTQLRNLHAQIQDLEDTGTASKKRPGSSDSRFADSATRQEQGLNEDQSKFKAASSEAKSLHRKIMMLTHEERHGKNPILREIFDLANAARRDNDVGALTELLGAAKKYHQSATDRRSTLEFLKQKRKAYAGTIKDLTAKKRSVQNSAPYTVHTLLERGQREVALSLFTSILENARENLQDQINMARMKLRHMKGNITQTGGV